MKCKNLFLLVLVALMMPLLALADKAPENEIEAQVPQEKGVMILFSGVCKPSDAQLVVVPKSVYGEQDLRAVDAEVATIAGRNSFGLKLSLLNESGESESLVVIGDATGSDVKGIQSYEYGRLTDVIGSIYVKLQVQTDKSTQATLVTMIVQKRTDYRKATQAVSSFRCVL